MQDQAISQSETFAGTWAEPQAAALPQAELDRLTEDLIAALKTVFDPDNIIAPGRYNLAD